MSTNIAIITGTQQVEIPTTTKIIDKPVKVTLTRFAGKEGKMLQIAWGFLGNEVHLHLNAKEVSHLKRALTHWDTTQIDL